MICRNCGAECRDDAKFCNVCGATIEAGAPAYEAPTYAAEPVAAAEPNKVMVIIGMALGIASAVFGMFACCLWWMAFLGIPCGIVGLIFSMNAKNEYAALGMEENVMAKLGFIFAIVGLALNGTGVIFGLAFSCLSCGVGGSGMFVEILEEFM